MTNPQQKFRAQAWITKCVMTKNRVNFKSGHRPTMEQRAQSWGLEKLQSKQKRLPWKLWNISVKFSMQALNN